jgi:hypothetical protein
LVFLPSLHSVSPKTVWLKGLAMVVAVVDLMVVAVVAAFMVEEVVVSHVLQHWQREEVDSAAAVVLMVGHAT